MKKDSVSHIYPDTLDEWLANIENLHPKNIEMGLDRARLVKEQLKIHFNCPVVIVGGTNGKGSTCAMMQTIWQKAGYRVGLYTSPHIHHFEERLRINGQNVSESVFVHYFKKVERARGNIPLTYFEFTTLAVLNILADTKLDVVILEVGLGGRLDAVNLIDANVAIVTNVDIDHVDYLGATRDSAGYEKAGIFRKESIAIYGDHMPPQSLLRYANEINTNLFIFGKDYHSVCDGNSWSYVGPSMRFNHLNLPALYGKNQIQNATNALMVLESMQDLLPFDEDSVQAGLAEVYLLGRFQVIQTDPVVILDVAHNPHAAVVLAENLHNMGNFHETYAIFGAMADKDIESIIAKLKETIDFWYLTNLPLARAATVETLKEKLILAGVKLDKIKLFESVNDALTTAKIKAQKNDRIVAFGSFWVVSGITQSTESTSSNIMN